MTRKPGLFFTPMGQFSTDARVLFLPGSFFYITPDTEIFKRGAGNFPTLIRVIFCRYSVVKSPEADF